MRIPPILSRTTLALAAAAPLMLAACSDDAEETTYEAGATDVSGGELIVREADEDAVEVDLPETEMTNVPPGETSEPLPRTEETVTPPAE